MLKVNIDGIDTEVQNGTTVIEAANGLGIYIPHFCYHKKLSIAANCRMCLVQVEKAPKPMPACATPVTDGMKVLTQSDYARQAQNGVMEFLLINHPLDCPICDQGGECQLQDLAVGYGCSNSRFEEEKRVVVNKNLGPLIATDMTRCIHCTRCVRYGQELAGVMELGMINRGEHAEIIAFVGRTVDSELSGNMIDLCPVGALTSKPFRYTARTWELSRRKSVSPHDGLGSNLVVQTTTNKVMRVVPLENEEINECWLSDKDRFSYDGLNSEDRITSPVLRETSASGEVTWRPVEWHLALEHIAGRLGSIASAHGAQNIGALASPHSTLEELYLLQKLVRSLGSQSVDFRLRQADFSADGKRAGVPWLGMKVTELAELDRVLVVGSFLRKDHPLLTHRFRQAAKRGQQFNLIHATDDELLLKVANKAIVAPAEIAHVLGQVIKAVAEGKQAGVSGESGAPAVQANNATAAEDHAGRIAASLLSGRKVGIFLGNMAQQHPQASQIEALVQQLAEALGAKWGFLGEAANSVGGHVAQCLPGSGGLNASSMLASPRKAYLLLNVEPELDSHDGRSALQAMNGAEFVVAMTAFRGRAPEYADVLLPIAPFTETSGSFINTEGRLQSFNGVIKPLGETRPAWKVLRVLANLIGVQGFDYDSSEQVRDEAWAPGRPPVFDNRTEDMKAPAEAVGPSAGSGSLQRIADVPIYFTDPIVRRSKPLQRTRDARPPRAWMNAAELARLGIAAGQKVAVRQDDGEALVEAALDDSLPAGCVRLAAAHPLTAELGPMTGQLTVEALRVEAAA
jgi:NADH-quinone oxidoreductase subunit G